MKCSVRLFVFIYMYNWDFLYMLCPSPNFKHHQITVITMALFEMKDAFDFYVKLDLK